MREHKSASFSSGPISPFLPLVSLSGPSSSSRSNSHSTALSPHPPAHTSSRMAISLSVDQGFITSSRFELDMARFISLSTSCTINLLL